MAQLRATAPMSLADARAAVDALPFKVGAAIERQEADPLRRAFEGAGATVDVRRVGSRPNPMFGPIQDYRLLLATGATDAPSEVEVQHWSVDHPIPVTQLKCGKCGTAHALAMDEESAPKACPRCAGILEQVGACVT
jgi:hypothetical protein